MAIKLKKAGIDDFIVLEKAKDVGGTWRDNQYPGCACDVESMLYCFSFAPSTDWTRLYSPQPDIHAYLRRCAVDFGVMPHIRFEHEFHHATWDDEARLWRLKTSKGELTAGMLIVAMGPLSEPKLPALKGLETFKGAAFHSARWRHDVDLRGKRVAVVGTGASAIQFVPEIQPRVGRLLLFQRTPPWILPRLDRPISAAQRRWLRRLPFATKIMRSLIFAYREALGLTFRHINVLRRLEKVGKSHMQRAIKDPELLRKVTPDYAIGCKRILLSNNYYPALAQPNVDVLTTGIREVREHAVVAEDGAEHPVDVLIFGTGFHVSDISTLNMIRGKAGLTIGETQPEGCPAAHLGMAFPGFPNLFMLLGPNTGLGHTSVVLMLEAQIDYIVSAIQYMRQSQVGVLDVTEAARAKFAAEVDRKSQGTVWTEGGCASWYLDSAGRNRTLWPESVPAYFRRLSKFVAADYDMRPHPTTVPNKHDEVA